MVIGTKATDIADRNADYRSRLAVPGILPIGAGSYIDGIFQHSRHGPVVFGSKKKQPVRRSDFATE